MIESVGRNSHLTLWVCFISSYVKLLRFLLRHVPSFRFIFMCQRWKMNSLCCFLSIELFCFHLNLKNTLFMCYKLSWTWCEVQNQIGSLLSLRENRVRRSDFLNRIIDGKAQNSTIAQEAVPYALLEVSIPSLKTGFCGLILYPTGAVCILISVFISRM